ncbi:energy transducer TonB [Lysobacter sp. A3-1-A15]|uniref:energy transducer TonB n=1 Tax=Novilysobacter viscosus TaxID=3098602 RepID=UPI002ED90A07
MTLRKPAPRADRPSRLVWLMVATALALIAAWMLRPSDEHAGTGPGTDEMQASPDSAANPATGTLDDVRSAAAPDGTAAVMRAATAPAEPVPASAIPPAFPLEAVRRGESGRVVLKVPVTVAGAPGAISVVTTSGSELLDRTAVEAVSRWRFVPARDKGRDVASTLEIPIDFRPAD